VIGDSGCTNVLLRNSNSQVLHSLSPFTGFQIAAANGNIMTSTKRGILRVPTSEGTIEIPSFVFPDWALSHNLLSFGELSQKGCSIFLTNTSITIYDQTGKPIWHTPKTPSAKTWDLNFADFIYSENGEPAPLLHNITVLPTLPSFQHNTNVSLHAIKHSTNAERVSYVHAVLGYLPISSLIKVVNKGWLHNMEPTLTAAMIRQNPPICKYTSFGFLDQIPSGQNSTKIINSNIINNSETDFNYDSFDEEIVLVKIVNTSDFLNSSDLTGPFPATSTNGYNYILISVLDNYVKPMLQRTKTKEAYTQQFKELYTFYASKGKKPKFQCLDNETSTMLLQFIANENIQIQLVPPHQHRANIAERIIRQAKNTIIAMVSALPTDFPTRSKFEKCITQAEIILNVTRPCSRIPSITAYEGMHGTKYDFLAHPLSVYGMKAVVFESPESRGTWANHGVEGFYLAPTLESYRTWTFLISSTNTTRNATTVQWFPDKLKLPGSSKAERFEAAFEDMRKALKDLTASDILNDLGDQPVSAGISSSISTKLRLFNDLMNNTDTNDDSSIQRVTEAPQTLTTALPTLFPPILDTQPTPILPISPFQPLTTNIPKKYLNHYQFKEIVNKRNITWEIVGFATNSNNTIRVGTPRKVYYKVFNIEKSPTTDIEYKYRLCYMIDKLVKSSNITWIPSIEPPIPTQIKPNLPEPTPTAPKPIRTFAPKPLQERGPPRRSTRTHPGRPSKYSKNDALFCTTITEIEYTLLDIAIAENIAFFAEGTYNATLGILNTNPDGTPLKHRQALNGPNREQWQQADDLEFTKLFETTKTLCPIHYTDVPTDRRKDVSYYNPQVKEKVKNGLIDRRTRGTAGGDRINYPGVVASKSASMELFKCIVNSAVSTDASLTTMDIKDFYLNTTLTRPEFLKIHRKQISDFIMDKYNLHQFLRGDYVTVRVDKGMYGLKQAGLLSHERLVTHLASHNYIEKSSRSLPLPP